MDSYGIILSNVFTNISGNKYKLEIYDRDSSDDNENIDLSVDAVKYNWETSGDDLMPHGVLAPSNLDVGLISETLTNYDYFKNADDTRYAAKFFTYNGASYDEYWRGYMIPSFFSKTWGNPPLIYDIKFSDLIGDLSNIPYATQELFLSDSTYFGGMKSQLDLICFCLSKLDTDIDSLKVCLTLFDSNNHNQTSTDTPIAQTYLDTNLFFKKKYSTALVEEVEYTASCEYVLNTILGVYGATLRQLFGSYWIVDLETYETSTTIDYVEYDLNGDYVTTGSTASFYDFDTNTASDRWRWSGTQRIIGTFTYKSVDLTLEGIVHESLTVPFQRDNAAFLLGYPFAGSWGFLNVEQKPETTTSINNECDIFLYDTAGRTLLPNNLNQIYEATIPTIDRFLVPDDEPLVYGITFKELANSDTYLQVTDSIQYDGDDKIRLDIEYKVSEGAKRNISRRANDNASNRNSREERRTGGATRGARTSRGGESTLTRNLVINPEGHYLILKWTLQIGSYYFNASELSWSGSSQTNQELISNIDNINKINLDIPLRDVTKTSETYTLKVWAVSSAECDLNGGADSTAAAAETAMLTNLKATAAGSFDIGERKVTKAVYQVDGEDQMKLYYYELVRTGEAVDEPNYVEAQGTTRKWKLATTRILEASPFTTTEFTKVDIIPLPKGKEVEENPKRSRPAYPTNKAVLDVSISGFDAPTFINNSENIYRNIFRYQENVISYPPTSNWINSVGDDFPIQTHFHDRILRLAKQSRVKINGDASFNSLAPSPLVSFNTPTDLNRIFIATSGTIDFKKSNISGDFVELISDEEPTVAAHELASHSSGHN